MADPYQVEVLKKGVEAWNDWRERNVHVTPDLSGLSLPVDFHPLIEADLRSADLTNAKLNRVILAKSDLFNANLSGAELNGAFLPNTNLIRTNFTNASLMGASLNSANLLEANMTSADLRKADLKLAHLVRTCLKMANLTGSSVYGASVWEADLDGAVQRELIITPSDRPTVTCDEIQVAQFLYLLIDNPTIRQVIDTITSKVVLILGRFTADRKPILDAIRDELRTRDYVPVLFDFDKPSNRDITETVSTLAHMAKFVIADITDARSIPQELMAIVPALPSVPVQPLLLASQREYGMFEHFKRYPWVLEPYLYDDQDRLLAAITDKVIGPAEATAKEQTRR